MVIWGGLGGPLARTWGVALRIRGEVGGFDDVFGNDKIAISDKDICNMTVRYIISCYSRICREVMVCFLIMRY